MMHRFKVVVPSFNSVDYISKTLHSIEMQSDRDYDVCVIDDGSTLSRQREIIADFCSRNKWQAIYHDKNYGALYGIVHAIPKMQCQDDDVIILVDGDDWLAHADVFKHVRQIYMQNDVHVTWGQCELYPQEKSPVKYAQPVPQMVIDQKLYRDIPFVFWHLRTFKYGLWKHISDADLRDENGEYFRIMSDKAYLYPLLEMAGKKIYFIEKTLYIYNVENPLNDYANTLPEEHLRVDMLIRERKRYPTVSLTNE